jgi:hypothetical protein
VTILEGGSGDELVRCITEIDLDIAVQRCLIAVRAIVSLADTTAMATRQLALVATDTVGCLVAIAVVSYSGLFNLQVLQWVVR